MQKSRIDELIKIYRDGLLHDTVPFWLRNATDHEYGGFFNYLDREGKVYGTDKSVWLLCRFTWLLSILYCEVEKKKLWLDAAASTIDFIEKHCFDADGRMFFEVTREGKPLRKRRYVFSETFGTIAFARYAQAANDKSRLEKAKSIFKTILCYYNNPQLLPPKYYPQSFQAKSHAMPMIIIATAQQLRKVWQDQLIEDTITRCMQEVFEHFMKPDLKALLENVGPNGEFINSPVGRCVNPGHAIETSWFILEEYRHRKDPELLSNALQILDWSLEIGWDNEFGGIRYFADVKGHPCIQYEHDMKLWWPHNEAIYATLLAYYLTKEKRYLDWFEKVHGYTYSHFPDPEYGDWIKYLHRDGTVSTTLKANGWAGSFHLPRMQLKCWQLLEKMKASM